MDLLPLVFEDGTPVTAWQSSRFGGVFRMIQRYFYDFYFKTYVVTPYHDCPDKTFLKRGQNF